MIECIITSRAKRNLLRLLLTNPDKEFYVRDIAARIDEPLNAARRDLKSFEKAGLVKYHYAGQYKYYSIVKEFPIYFELKRLFDVLVTMNDFRTNIPPKKGR